VEANMPLSLGSYLLGVGTVLGAIAFGFGGGVLLTHTAMKESPAGQTRAERLVRAEPQTPAAQVTQTPNQAAVAPNQVTTPDQDHPASGAINQDTGPAEQPAAVSPDPVPAAPKPDAAREPVPEAPKQIQAAREPQPPKQVEQTERAKAKSVDSGTDRSSRSAGRSRRYAEQRWVCNEWGHCSYQRDYYYSPYEYYRRYDDDEWRERYRYRPSYGYYGPRWDYGYGWRRDREDDDEQSDNEQ
jgi:hypothetical protein